MVLFNRKYFIIIFTTLYSIYIYRNYFKNNNGGDKIEGKKEDKIEDKKLIKPLTPIQKLARKAGIIETVLNMDIIDEPELDPGIGLRLEEINEESKNEGSKNEESKNEESNNILILELDDGIDEDTILD